MSQKSEFALNAMEGIGEFKKELSSLISKYSMENLEDGNVPDFILADVMADAMISFCREHKRVCDWYSVILEPGNSKFTDWEKAKAEEER